MMKMTKIGTVIASLLVVGAANAAAPGAYVGVGAGASIIRTPNLGTIDVMGTNLKTSQQRGGLGGRIFAGYNFNQYFGLETALATYAKSTYKVSGMGQSATLKDSLYALSLVGKGYLPLSDTGLSAYALGGLAEVRNEEHASGTKNNNHNVSSLRPTYGVGMSYDATSHVTTSLELSRIQGKGNMKKDANAIPTADMVSLNVGYNFG